MLISAANNAAWLRRRRRYSFAGPGLLQLRGALLLLAAAVAVALCFRLAVRDRSASIRSSRVRLASLLSPPAFSFRLAERSFIGSE